MSEADEVKDVVEMHRKAFDTFHDAVLDYFEVMYLGQRLDALSDEAVTAALKMERALHADQNQAVRNDQPRNAGSEKLYQLLTALEVALARRDYAAVAKEYFRIASAIRSEQRCWLEGKVERRDGKVNHMHMLVLMFLAGTKVRIANLLRCRK